MLLHAGQRLAGMSCVRHVPSTAKIPTGGLNADRHLALQPRSVHPWESVVVVVTVGFVADVTLQQQYPGWHSMSPSGAEASVPAQDRLSWQYHERYPPSSQASLHVMSLALTHLALAQASQFSHFWYAWMLDLMTHLDCGLPGRSHLGLSKYMTTLPWWHLV